MSYLEVSAKTAENIQEAFRIVSCSLIEKHSGNSIENKPQLIESQSFSCCRG
jgi:hypothetical protein